MAVGVGQHKSGPLGQRVGGFPAETLVCEHWPQRIEERIGHCAAPTDARHRQHCIRGGARSVGRGTRFGKRKPRTSVHVHKRGSSSGSSIGTTQMDSSRGIIHLADQWIVDCHVDGVRFPTWTTSATNMGRPHLLPTSCARPSAARLSWSARLNGSAGR